MNLTIIDAKSHEPLLVLSEDDKGMSVVGGDPKMVQVLGLQQFSNLKEVADYINSAESDVQAIFDGQGEQDAPAQDGSDNPDMDARIKPALDMIRGLMQKVNDRKKRDKIKENEEKPETKLLNTSESEIMMNPNEQIYVSLDGDNIGNAVARAEEHDDEEKLKEISDRINAGQDVMKDWTIRMGGHVVEQGGDEGVVKVPATAMKDIETLRELYRQAVGNTASVGVGKKISESTKARMLAKLKGKNQTVVFDASTIQELDLRLQDKDTTEANKLRTAMRPDEGMSQDHPENPKMITPSSDQGGMPQAKEDSQAHEQEEIPEYSGSKLSEAKKAEVQQEDKPKKVSKAEPKLKEEGKPVGSIDHDLVKDALNMPQEPKTGTKYGDSSLDDLDLSEHDDPDYVRNFLYTAKHGGRK